MHPLWARHLQRWTATTKKKVEHVDEFKKGVWHTRTFLMHLPSVEKMFLKTTILCVRSTGVTKQGSHLHGRLLLYELFEHLIKDNLKPPPGPSYVDMALLFTKDVYIAINPSHKALMSLGSPIAVDTEGNCAEYAQVTDGRRSYILRMCKRENRAALAELLLSQRQKLFWGDNDGERLKMHVAEPWTGDISITVCIVRFTHIRCSKHV